MKLARFKFHSGQTQHPRGRQKYEIRLRSAGCLHNTHTPCGAACVMRRIEFFHSSGCRPKQNTNEKWLKTQNIFCQSQKENQIPVQPSYQPAISFSECRESRGSWRSWGKQWEQRNQCVTDIYGTFQNSQLFCTTSIVGKWPSNRKKQVVETYEQPAYMAVKYPVEFL